MTKIVQEVTAQLCSKIEETSRKKKRVSVSSLMVKATLCVIGVAGFGKDMRQVWKEKKNPQSGENSFSQVVSDVANKLNIYVGIPHWITENIPIEFLSKMHKNYRIFFQSLDEMISGFEPNNKKKDLLSLLIQANQEEKILSDSELKSNSFIFLLAGRKFPPFKLAFGRNNINLFR